MDGEGVGGAAAGLLADTLLDGEGLTEVERLLEVDGVGEGLLEGDDVAEKVPLFAVSPKFTMITPPLPKRTCARSIHGTRSHNRHRCM